VDTPGAAGGFTVRLVAPAARAWRALAYAAIKAGHTLKPTGPADSYRPYEVQERIFRQRYTTTYLAGRPYKVWNGRRWYQKPGTAVAAVPGSSNHGLGLAVDTGEERDSDAGAESLDNPTLLWLLNNELRYGFSHEVQSEPWHIRYFAGDKIPKAVLDHEQQAQPEPGEDEEMGKSQIAFYKGYDGKGTHAYHLVGNVGKWLPTPEAIQLLDYLDVPRANPPEEPLSKVWADTVILVDGPCKNR
jgi:hypothetical protein